jgi:hypothetical protein
MYAKLQISNTGEYIEFGNSSLATGTTTVPVLKKFNPNHDQYGDISSICTVVASVAIAAYSKLLCVCYY